MDETQPNRKTSWPLRPFLVIGLLFVVSTVAVWPFLHHLLTRPSRDEVLSQFDHTAILHAARSMMDAVPNTHFGRSSNPDTPIDDPRIPPTIRDLNPRYVGVWDDHVQIEFAGGFEHYGLYASREGTPERFGRTVIEGLTFYSD